MLHDTSHREDRNLLLRDANLTIVCGKSTEMVHSFVLSPYFTSLCKGKFMEAGRMLIEFDEEDLYLVHRMLIYCYRLSWPEFKMKIKQSQKGEEQWVSRLDTIVKMYALGSKLDIKELKQHAGERFTARLDEAPASSLQLLPRPFLGPVLGPAQPITEFIDVIPLIYATTPDIDRGLRDRAAEYGADMWKTLWAQPAFKNRLTEIGDFVNDVITEGQNRAGKKDARVEEKK